MRTMMIGRRRVELVMEMMEMVEMVEMVSPLSVSSKCFAQDGITRQKLPASSSL